MTIEVRQLNISSTVEDKKQQQPTSSDKCNSLAQSKDEILSECEQLILKILSEQGER